KLLLLLSTIFRDLRFIALSTGELQGIDGIALIVNGVLVQSTEEIEELIELNGYLDATFILVKAKTASSFSLGDMSVFAETATSFFEDDPVLLANPDVKDHHDLKVCVFDNASRFRRNPQLYLYYVTTGRWDGPVALESHRAKTINRLNETNLFSEVAYLPIGASEVRKWYRKTKTSRMAEI